MGGTHARVSTLDDPEIKNKIKKLDDSLFLVNIILGMFALTDCKDTLIGDNDTVRGISGGEKRRVTCAEIMMSGVPFFCLDEVEDKIQKTSGHCSVFCSVFFFSFLPFFSSFGHCLHCSFLFSFLSFLGNHVIPLHTQVYPATSCHGYFPTSHLPLLL